MAKILVVDDSSLSRRILRRILESAGHTVTEAVDGATAMETYFLERPDLVMLDLTMRDINGLEVLERLRQLDPRARILIATADIQNSTRQMAEDRGARGLLNKPFAAEQVLAAVEATLAGGTS